MYVIIPLQNIHMYENGKHGIIIFISPYISVLCTPYKI